VAHLAAIDKEGCINAVDRKTDRVKTGGEKVASREVEALTDRLPAVSEVAVNDLSDAKWGEAVTVIVVPKAGHALSEDEVVAHCSEQTARFKAPERVVFAQVLPKQPSGKRLKRKLRQRYACADCASAHTTCSRTSAFGCSADCASAARNGEASTAGKTRKALPRATAMLRCQRSWPMRRIGLPSVRRRNSASVQPNSSTSVAPDRPSRGSKSGKGLRWAYLFQGQTS
jgi:hypothetical protein